MRQESLLLHLEKKQLRLWNSALKVSNELLSTPCFHIELLSMYFTKVYSLRVHYIQSQIRSGHLEDSVEYNSPFFFKMRIV